MASDPFFPAPVLSNALYKHLGCLSFIENILNNSEAKKEYGHSKYEMSVFLLFS